MINRWKLIAFVLVIVIAGCNRDEDPIDSKTELEEYLLDEMEDQHIPALATLVFNGDEVLYESYLGESNISSKKALGENDKFLLASVSKTVTATALLQLYDKGHFSLNGPN